MTMALNPRQLAMLQAVRDSGSLKTEQLAERFQTTLQTVRRDVQRLTDAGVLERFHGGVRAPATPLTPSASAATPTPNTASPAPWRLPSRRAAACS
jgi:DeoR/GlpR family transcriptional regulator of sugar metabolism